MSEPGADPRSILEDERGHLRIRVDELTVGGEVNLEFDSDFADRGQVTGEKGANRTLAAALQAQLNLVEKALRRLDDGSYGTCEVCGEPIGAERLEAVPAAARCIKHAGAGVR